MPHLTRYNGLVCSSLRTLAAEFPTFSIARSNCSCVTPKCLTQCLISSSFCTEILLRSGMAFFGIGRGTEFSIIHDASLRKPIAKPLVPMILLDYANGWAQ